MAWKQEAIIYPGRNAPPAPVPTPTTPTPTPTPVVDLKYIATIYRAGYQNSPTKEAWTAVNINTWESFELPIEGSWHSNLYGNGRFVLIDIDDKRISLSSQDGVNWLQGSIPADFISSWQPPSKSFAIGPAAFTNGIFIVMNDDGSSCIKSTDGINWDYQTINTDRPAHNVGLSSIVGNNTNIIACSDQSGGVLYSLDNGANWIWKRILGDINNVYGWYGAAYGKGKFVFVQNGASSGTTTGGRCAVTTDFNDFIYGNMPTVGGWSLAGYDPVFEKYYVYTYSTSPPSIYSSIDGLVWSYETSTRATGDFVFDGDNLIIPNGSMPTILQPNGVWKDITIVPTTGDNLIISASYISPAPTPTPTPTPAAGLGSAIFGYGYGAGGVTSLSNLVSNTGVVASDVTGVGTSRQQLSAAGYGTDKAIFGYGITAGTILSLTNLVSNSGVVSTDAAGVGTTRAGLAAAGYGTDKALFGYGYNVNTNITPLSMINLVSNSGIVSTDTSGIGTARFNLAAAGYGTDKAIFGYGTAVGGASSLSVTNLVTNAGVVSNDTTGVGTSRNGLAAARYGTDKALFGYGYGATGIIYITNLVSNTGVVSTDTAGVGTPRYSLAAAGYGTDKAIFGFGEASSGAVSITNLVSNIGVVSSDVVGVGLARYGLAAASIGG